MTISQMSEQLHLGLASRDVCVMLANRPQGMFVYRGKDVDHAKPICSRNCLGFRSTTAVGGVDPSPFHPASLGLSVSANLADGSCPSAFQSTGRQRVRLQSQHGGSVANPLSATRPRGSSRRSAVRSAAELFPPTNNWKSSRWPPAKRPTMIASPVNGALTIWQPSWSTGTLRKRCGAPRSGGC